MDVGLANYLMLISLLSIMYLYVEEVIWIERQEENITVYYII